MTKFIAWNSTLQDRFAVEAESIVGGMEKALKELGWEVNQVEGETETVKGDIGSEDELKADWDGNCLKGGSDGEV